MSTIKIKWTVDEIANVLLNFDVERVYRSTTGESGVYTVLDTVALVAGQEDYEYDDTSGDTSYYYKTSHYNTSTTEESDKSDPYSVASAQDPALSVITVDELKELYLFGLDLSDDTGTEMPDSLYEHFIASAVDWVEKRLDIPLIQKDITEEPHDYYREDYEQYIWLETQEYPVISVSEVKMVMPGEASIQTFDSDWIHLREEAGQIQIVPGTSGPANTLFLANGQWLPYFYGRNRFIPDVFRVTYSAGFSTIPPQLKDIVGKVASFGPLNIAGDLLGGAGIASQSISIDGLSQTFNTTSSATNAGYGARILAYNRELKDVIPTLQRYYKGLRISVM
jgi:hypothetical protein